MAVLFFNSDVLLTATEVQKRMNDLQQWQAEITSLQKQVAETQAWLNLVAKLIGPERANQLIGDVLLPTQVGTSNEAIPPSEQNPRRSRIGDEIKRFLKTQTNGATSRQIIDHLLQIQEFQEVVQRNSNGNVYTALSRLVKRHEVRKIESSYYSPVARPKENSGSEEETAVSAESSEARLSSKASRDAEPTHTDVGRDRDASGSGPLTSTDYVGRDPTPIPAEFPATKSTPTKSLFQTDSAAAPPEVPPAQSPLTRSSPTKSSPTKSLFQTDSAAVAPDVQIQPMDYGRED